MSEFGHRVSQPRSVHLCTVCKSDPMRLTSVKPLALSVAAEELHYRCARCGAEETDIRTFAPRRKTV